MQCAALLGPLSAAMEASTACQRSAHLLAHSTIRVKSVSPARADTVLAAARSSAGRAVGDHGVLPQRVPHGRLPASALLRLDPLCHRPHSVHLQEESAGAPLPPRASCGPFVSRGSSP